MRWIRFGMCMVLGFFVFLMIVSSFMSVGHKKKVDKVSGSGENGGLGRVVMSGLGRKERVVGEKENKGDRGKVRDKVRRKRSSEDMVSKVLEERLRGKVKGDSRGYKRLVRGKIERKKIERKGIKGRDVIKEVKKLRRRLREEKELEEKVEGGEGDRIDRNEPSFEEIQDMLFSILEWGNNTKGAK